ncbi:hypothetical protein [Mesonia aquimarina]|uniref:hypothetical protein n=1 Tax=Mesonia aquimarina TaxID=1504967 RepID=UPI000EF5ECD5|nr:hypothetical protein [Mesonia aquimarina]
MKKQLRFCLLFLIFAFVPFHFMAQNVTVQFSEDQLEASNGEVISFYIKMINNEAKPVVVDVDFEYDKNAVRLASGKSEYALAANDTTFIPLKGIINRKAIAGKNSAIIAKFSSNNKTLGSQVLSLSITEKKMVRFYMSEENLTFEHIGDTLAYEVTIDNLGNTKQRIRLLSRFPKSPTKDELSSELVEIEAFQDTTFTLQYIVDEQMMKLDDFSIALKTLYSNGDIFGTSRLKVNSVKQARRFQKDLKNYDPSSITQDNIVSLSARKSRDNYQYYFYANNQIDLKQGSIQSNIDVNWWETSNALYIRNTWFQYTTNRFGVKAGNLFRSDIVNLIGRGVESYYHIDEQNRIEVGGMNKSYSLINTTDNKYGNAGWANFSHNGGWLGDGYEASVIYHDDPALDYKSYIGTGRTNVIDRENLKVKAGASLSKTSLYTDESTSENGGAGELMVFAKKGRFRLNSNNYYSSAYYSGLRQGALNLTERLSYNLEKYNFWVLYNYLSFAPKQLSSQNINQQNFSTAQYNFGISRRFENLSVSLVPNYYKEKRTSLLFSGQEAQEFTMRAKRLTANLGYNHIISQQSVSLNLEGGVYNTDLQAGETPHFKVNLNYNWRFFNLNAYYQYNSFFLGEEFSKIRFASSGAYEVYNILPSIEKDFFNEKLRIRTGVSFSKSSFTDEYLQLNGRIDYQLPANFNVYFSTFLSDFSTSYYNTSTMQVGIIKRFSKIDVTEKRHNLKVYVYRNTNDSLKKVPAVGQLLLINNKAFRTNEKGVVSYRRLPADHYDIKVFNTKDWYASDQEIDLIDDAEVVINMDKTVTIKGKVSYKSTELSYNVPRELGSLTVTLINAKGEHFKAKTDANGYFRVYVPEGDYTANIEMYNRASRVEVIGQGQKVKATSGTLENINFIFRVKDRKVERKKFKSSGF